MLSNTFLFFISGVFRTIDGSDNENGDSQSISLSDSGNGSNEQQLFPDRKKQLIPAKNSNQLFSDGNNNNQLFPDAHKQDPYNSAVNQQFPLLKYGVAALKEDSVVSSLPGGNLDDGDQLMRGVDSGWGRIRRIRRQEQQQHLTNGGGQADLSGNMPGARVRKLFPLNATGYANFSFKCDRVRNFFL
jgi:hypothetical protein